VVPACPARLRAPALTLAALLCFSAAPARANPSLLAEVLDPLLSDPRLSGVEIGVSVRAAATGDLLYEHQAATHLPAASNQKLLTSTAALADLGPDYRFETTVLAGAPPAAGVVAGDLYLRGTGDPTLLPERFDELAAAVAGRGVSEVRGGLVADDTWFDTERLGYDWSQQDEQFAYAAPISALSVAPDPDFDTGSVQVDIAPGDSVGGPASVGLTPPTTVIQLVNRAVTGSASSARLLSATRNKGTELLIVDGSLPVGSRASHPLRSVGDPTAYAADVFRTALERHGVHIAGPTRSAATPAGATQLAHLESMPLAELLVPFLKLSNNPIAEILVKSMGRHDAADGSWEAGLAVVRRFAAAEGIDSSQLQLFDGSGLSTADLIAPNDLTTLLVAVQSQPWFPVWYAALPIAGQPDHLVGGTLSTRMQQTPAAGNVHAKTGSLTTTSALSGYVTDASGGQLAFSVVTNGFIGPPPIELEDAIAVALAEWSEGA
jgi:D-alanyl-D-alanine carboxypeptidase/D-alanyl-D-alanine-endopeptidase (penicillin-binding protein 4)